MVEDTSLRFALTNMTPIGVENLLGFTEAYS